MSSLDLEKKEEPEGFLEWREQFESENNVRSMLKWVREIIDVKRPRKALNFKWLQYFVLREIYDAKNFSPLSKEDVAALKKAMKKDKQTDDKEQKKTEKSFQIRQQLYGGLHGNLQGPLLYPDKEDQKRKRSTKNPAMDGLIYGLARKFYWYISCLPLTADISKISEMKLSNLPMDMRPSNIGYIEHKLKNDPRPKMNISIAEFVQLVFQIQRTDKQIERRLDWLRDRNVLYVGWPRYWEQYLLTNATKKKR